MSFTLQEIIDRCKTGNKGSNVSNAMPPLFRSESEYENWKANRSVKELNFTSLKDGIFKETLYLGIDSGSTTTKIVIIDDAQNIVYQRYANNEGNSLKKVSEGLQEFFRQAKEAGVSARIAASAVTGYGEDLIKQAFNLDFGIVETMAHLAGAKYINPDVSFILDIGGQDMKSIFVRNGVISNIELNEACSSGCGSFLQNFASTMNLTLAEFTQKACLAPAPSDLGTRCTVFMNSKVKQSLRENAGIDNIAAGLAYSVVKNCLFKVLKISNINTLGDNIVVQGGTFRNDAVYRALELLSGKNISTTNYPELMGAFGAALYAQQMSRNSSNLCVAPHLVNTHYPSDNSVLRDLRALTFEVLETSSENLNKNLFTIPKYETKEITCKGCTNQCRIIRFNFENGNICYAGNKCEKMFSSSTKTKDNHFNSFDYKNDVIFGLSNDIRRDLSNLEIGIPRVLNIYENYPFWKTLFEDCGFEVRLSPKSTFEQYQSGVGSIMSDNICFPAKLVHGHILSLVEQGINRIFYPIVPKDEYEFGSSSNSYNCPIVSGYPDVIRSAIDPEIPYDTPVISFHSEKALKKSCETYFSGLGVDKRTFSKAFANALQNKNQTQKQLIENQQKLLEKALIENSLTFVVAGRPYHADPLINQKIGQIIVDLGVGVLTDDVFRTEFDTGKIAETVENAKNTEKQSLNLLNGAGGNLNIVSQWSYPNRVIQSALQVARLPQNIQMIQLNSFGCGPDSFFMDEAAAILQHSNKNLTIIRIDEIASPGSVRLRLRSL
ncbi:MAG: acyl-CoA dehydratase activase-related protein, partial [Bacteroidales bacterium]|nr:acyl-CoA dehydratase activase-related protein [Bacteroidales bacterium]